MGSQHDARRPLRNFRVDPEAGSCKDIVEIRPKRKLRILHFNARPRDEEFKKEMEMYLHFRQNGMPDTVLAPPSNFKTQKVDKKSTAETISTPKSSRSTASEKKKEEEDFKDIETIPSARSDKYDGPAGGVTSLGNVHQESWSSKKLAKNGDEDPSRKENQLKINTTEAVQSSLVVNATEINSKGVNGMISPSRVSTYSEGAQSASGVQVGILSRPNSLRTDLEVIKEKHDVEKNQPNISEEAGETSTPHTPKSPKRTKGYRPPSSGLRKSAKSLGSTSVTNARLNREDSDLINALATDCELISEELKAKKELIENSPLKDAVFFFIHGVGGSADVWTAQVDYFVSLGLEVVAPDLIGHGFSSSPDRSHDYHFTEIVKDMEAVFDQFCNRQNVIIGHSYGCAFAVVLGRRRVRRVQKLVLMSGGGPTPLAPQPGVFSLPVCILSCVQPCIASSFERSAFHDKKKHVKATKELAFDVPTYVLSYMMNGQLWLDGDELYHSWLNMPTLLIYGKHDKFVSLEEEQEMERTIFTSHLEVVENASHMVMMEAPEQVNKLLVDFIFHDQVFQKQDDDEISIKSAERFRSKSVMSAKSAKSSKSHKHATKSAR